MRSLQESERIQCALSVAVTYIFPVVAECRTDKRLQSHLKKLQKICIRLAVAMALRILRIALLPLVRQLSQMRLEQRLQAKPSSTKDRFWISSDCQHTLVNERA